MIADMVAEKSVRLILIECDHVIDDFSFAYPTRYSATRSCQGPVRYQYPFRAPVSRDESLESGHYAATRRVVTVMEAAPTRTGIENPQRPASGV